MSLLRFLNSDKNARKVFGKRELKIIEKQLLGLNLTQSEKNRLSRDVRQKLEFIKEASRFSEEFKLKKGFEIKKMVEEAKKTILNDILFRKIKKVLLFGSLVDNKLTLKSDIDIAVKFDNVNIKESALFRKRISGKVNQKVDVQVYNHLPSKIKKEIDNKGRILYKNENK